MNKEELKSFIIPESLPGKLLQPVASLIITVLSIFSPLITSIGHGTFGLPFSFYSEEHIERHGELLTAETFSTHFFIVNILFWYIAFRISIYVLSEVKNH